MKQGKPVNKRVPARHVRNFMRDHRIQLAFLPIAPARRKQNRRTYYAERNRNRKQLGLSETWHAFNSRSSRTTRNKRERSWIANAAPPALQPQTQNQPYRKAKQKTYGNQRISRRGHNRPWHRAQARFQ